MANPGPLRAETAAGCGHGLNHTTYTAHSNGGPSGLKTLGKEGFYRAHTTPGIRRQDAYRNVAEATLDFSELTLEWGDDWICFLDAVTQAALCSLVPKTLQEGIRNKLAGIGSLTIDPTLQEFSGTSTCLKAMAYSRENVIVCSGIKLQNLQTLYETIPSACLEEDSSPDGVCFVPHARAALNNASLKNDTENMVTTDDACLGTSLGGDSPKLDWRLNLHNARDSESSALTVYCAGLHPSDQALIFGNLTAAALCSPDVTLLGRDAAGCLGDGRRVMAAVPAACRTRVNLTDHIVLDVPDQWSMEQAATVPTAYSAAYYLCHMKTQLRPADTILVMDMLDPVGQAIARLARQKALNVIGSVQTKANRDLVINSFPEFPPQKVVCRDNEDEWTRRVAQLAGDQGVDMIVSTLNAVDSRDCRTILNKGGTFLYVGDHSFDDYRNMKPRVDWEISIQRVDISRMLSEKSERAASIRREVALLANHGIKDGTVKPLDHAVFKASDTDGLLDAMRVKTWTKLFVVQIQEEATSAKAKSSRAQEISVPKRVKCDGNRSYLLVGALDTFGIEVAYWLVTRGARRIVLSSREGVNSAYQQYKIQQMLELGAEVVVASESGLTLESATQLLQEASRMGQLGGVFIINMEHSGISHSEEEKCINNFDRATRASEEVTDVWFVVCSPINNGRGFRVSANQSSNVPESSIQRVCERRRADCMLGLAIQWGPIDCGNLRESDGSNRYVPLSVNTCLQSLDKAMCQDAPLVDIYKRQEVTDQETELPRETETKEPNLTDQVLAILGLKVLPTDGMTLLEAGIDSLGTTEVIQLLEKQVGLSVENSDVRALTFKRLKELQQ